MMTGALAGSLNDFLSTWCWLVLRAVEIAVDVDEETSAARTERHRWGELRPIECPSVDSIVGRVIVDEDLIIAVDKDTPWVREIRRDDGLELPLSQMMIWPVLELAATTVLLVVMKRPRGDEPMMLFVANVMALGFQVALGQNFGWFNEAAKWTRHQSSSGDIERQFLAESTLSRMSFQCHGWFFSPRQRIFNGNLEYQPFHMNSISSKEMKLCFRLGNRCQVATEVDGVHFHRSFSSI